MCVIAAVRIPVHKEKTVAKHPVRITDDLREKPSCHTMTNKTTDSIAKNNARTVAVLLEDSFEAK